MTGSNGIILMTEQELYVLSAIYGLDKLSGSFSREDIRPDEHMLPYILNSLSNKGLIVSDGLRISVTEKTAKLLECYKEPHSVVFLRFGEGYLPDICCICRPGCTVCTERLLHQNGGLKMFMSTPEGVYEYLNEEGFLDSIPYTDMGGAQPDEKEYAQKTKTVLSIEKHFISRETANWEVFYSSQGCFMQFPDLTVAYTSAQAFEAVIEEILG